MPYPLGHEGEGTENGQFHKIWLQYKRKVHFFPISTKKLLFSTFQQSFRRNFYFLKFDDNEESLRSRNVKYKYKSEMRCQMEMGGLQRTKYVQNTTLGFRNIRQLDKCHSLRNTTQNRKSGKSTHDNSQWTRFVKALETVGRGNLYSAPPTSLVLCRKSLFN